MERQAGIEMEQELRRAIALRDALIRISMIINSTLDIEEIMQKIAIEAVDIIGGDSAFIALAEGKRWRIKHLYKLPQELSEKDYSDNDLPHIVIAANTKKPIAISDASRDNRVNPEIMGSMGVKSVLTIPLMVRDRAIGAVCFNYQVKEVDFGATEINFARQVASSLSFALSNASLYGEVKEARDLDAALNRINILIHSTLNIDEIMNRVITEGTEAIGAESAMVLFQSGNQWEVRYIYKLHAELIGRKYDSETVKHTVIAVQTKEPVSISDVHHDDRIDPHFAESLHIKSQLDLPLLAKEKALGDVVFHYHSKPVVFSDTHIEFARKLAASLASALANSQLFDQLRKTEEELRVSEARLYSIASTALDAVILIDSDGNVSFWNYAATRIFGYTDQEVSGKYLHSFIMPERHIDTFRKGFETFQKTGQGPFIGKVYETEGKRKDGTEFPVELSLASLKLRGKWNAVGIVRDITVRKQEEKARAYLSAIVESTNTAVISLTKDLNGIIQTWNKGAERVYGYSAEEAVGRHISFLVPPGHQNDVPDILERMKREEPVERYETVRMRKDGTLIHVSLDVSPIIDPQGTIVGASTIAYDITDRKRAEDTLRESREQLQIIIDTVPSLISYVDRNFHYRWNNRAYREWFKRTAEEITGRHMRDVLGETVFQRILPRLQKALSGEAVQYDDYLAYPTGGRWVHGVYMPHRTAHGEVDGIVVFVSDITDRKQAEDQMRQSKELSDAINRINAVIFSTLDFDEIMHRVIEEAVKAADVDSAAIYMPDGDRWVARYTYGLPGFEGKRVTEEDIKYSVIAAKERRPVVINNIPANEEMCRIHFIQEYGVKALLDAPLLVGEDVIGNFALYSCREAGVFNEQHMDFFNKVSASVSLAVKNARLFASLRESKERMQKAMSIETVGVLFFNLDGRIIEANAAFERMSGYSSEELRGITHWKTLTAPEFWEATVRTAENLATRGETPPYEKQMFRKDGSRWWGLFAPTRIAGSGLNSECTEFIIDITERKRMEEEIKHMAHHDALTGLPNRRLFRDIVNIEMAQARRNRKRLAVLFLDLDRFKEVNDTLGHEAGDALLKEVARRLRANIRESDTVARIGGDEFNILLADIARPEYVTAVAQKIMSSFERPFVIADHELHVTTSIGISICPDDSEEADTLFRYADIAMYHAKEKGKNTYEFYNPAINVRSVERVKFESFLRQTIERGELSVHYQPQIDLKTRRIVCAEALVRWRHPELGMLPSQRFIPLAEEIGFVTAIDEWVLRTACAQFKTWHEAGYPPLCVTVNLSARGFQNPGLVATIGRILSETGLSPDCLDIEITESMAMRDINHTAKQLNELTAMGVHISIDDFGIGYSSLSYLKRLPIQRLKIDQSFVKDITTDPDDRAIIQAVTAMAHTMKMVVVAEGVETKEQLSFLYESQCDEAQGYLFNKPLPPERFTELMAAGK